MKLQSTYIVQVQFILTCYLVEGVSMVNSKPTIDYYDNILIKVQPITIVALFMKGF